MKRVYQGSSNRIKEIRVKKGLSTAELAAMIDPPTSPQQINSLEADRLNVSFYWLKKISKVLGCKPYELLPIEMQPPVIEDDGVNDLQNLFQIREVPPLKCGCGEQSRYSMKLPVIAYNSKTIELGIGTHNGLYSIDDAENMYKDLAKCFGDTTKFYKTFSTILSLNPLVTISTELDSRTSRSLETLFVISISGISRQKLPLMVTYFADYLADASKQIAKAEIQPMASQLYNGYGR